MERSYWLNKWASGNIGFHQDTANPALTAHIDRLELAPGARIFLPLCGKTRDIGWLLSQGYRICGAELSEQAIEQLFDDLAVIPKRMEHGAVTFYTAPDIEIAVGDLFDLTAERLGPVDAVYDRAALVALPREMRERYAAHLTVITNRAPQLLVCYVYDQAAMAGPPFSVDREQVEAFYSTNYTLNLLSHEKMQGKLKDTCEADQMVWLLEGETRR